MSEISSLKVGAETMRCQIDVLMGEKNDLLESCLGLKMKIQNLDIENMDTSASIQKMRDEIKDLTSKLSDCEASNDEKMLEIVDLRHINEEIKDKEATALENVQLLQAQVLSLSDSVKSTKANIFTLESEKEEELKVWRSKWADVTDKNKKLNVQLAEQQAENARLCGHQNAKQKIQQHMNLKKDIDVQAAIVKQQQETIVSLTLERDTALADIRKLRMLSGEFQKTASGAGNGFGYSSSIVATVKAKRMPLKDSNTGGPAISENSNLNGL
jgi:chromosome segregation ATPase